MVCRVAVTVLLGLLFLGAAAAQGLTSEDVQHVCAQPAQEELCYASRRGGVERNQFAEERPQEGCRMIGFRREDLGTPVRLCPGAPGHWTNAGLQDACRRDPSGPCRYFINGAVARGIVEMRLKSRQAFCFKGGGSAQKLLDQADQLMPDLFLRWISANPGRAQEPAVLGLEHALADAYPCSPEEAVIKLRGLFVCNGTLTDKGCPQVQPGRSSR